MALTPARRRSPSRGGPSPSGAFRADRPSLHRLDLSSLSERLGMPSHSTNWQGSVSRRHHSRHNSTGVAAQSQSGSPTAAHPPAGPLSRSVPPSPMHRNGYSLADPDGERRPLLRSQTTLSGTGRGLGADGETEPLTQRPNRMWRRASRVSDWVSGHSHSGAATPAPRWEDGFYRPQARAAKTGYDAEFQDELAGEAGNGLRVWYDSLTSVDWLHDTIKESYRRRRLRSLKGLRGHLIMSWDGLQGWILITMIGVITALFAGAIVTLEMWLFDIKEGYCTNNWRSAKRFCCVPPAKPSLAFSLSSFSLLPFTNLTLASAGRAFSPGSFVANWSPSGIHALDSTEEDCADWRTWSEAFARAPGIEGDDWKVDWAVLILFALTLAGLSSLMTVYWTCSESVYSSKDQYISSPHAAMAGPIPNSTEDTKEGPRSTYGAVDDAAEDEGVENGEASGSSPAEPLEATAAAREAIHRPGQVMYFAAGSGIPEIKCILSGFVIRGYLGTWTLATKSLGLALSVASGLSLGKEGPFVHIASCIGNILTRFFAKFDRNEGKRREVLSAACAAGVAVAFGAPVGGVLFSLEEVSYFFPPRVLWRSFWCAMTAAATLRMLNPYGTGKTVLFEVTYDKQWHFIELIGFAALGVIGGVLGAYFARANIWWTKHVRRGTWVKRHPVVEVLLVTALTVAIGFFNPWLKMSGTELVYEMLAECTNRDDEGLCIKQPGATGWLLASVLVAALLKLLITVITFGLKVPAGIFVPSLAVGACIGRAAGLAIEYAYHFHPEAMVFEVCRAAQFEDARFGQACILPGVWAMVGAAAMLAGVTRTTVSLAVIVMELTGSLAYVVPIMLGVLIAKTTADAIEIRSIYDLVIEASDLPYLDAKTEYIHLAAPTDIMDTAAAVIELNKENTVSSLHVLVSDLYASGAAGGFPIVTREHEGLRVYGYIGAGELDHALNTLGAWARGDAVCTFRNQDPAATPVLGTLDFGHLVDHAPVTVSTRSPMELLHEMFVRLGVRYLVIQDERGLYRGLIEKNRWLRYLSWVEERQKHGGPLVAPLDHHV